MSCMKNKMQDILRKAVNLGDFSVVLDKLKVVSAGDGKISAEMRVENEHTNANGALHAGMMMTVLDVISALAVRTHPEFVKDSQHKLGVTLHLRMSYLKDVTVGDTVFIETNTNSYENSIGNTTTTFSSKIHGHVIAVGGQNILFNDYTQYYNKSI